MLIPAILQRAVELYPHKEAVVSGDRRLTYAAFGERVDRLAGYLLSTGVKKGGCVAVLHHNSHEFLEAYFAAARIGAILNPLNTRLSPGELTAILKETLHGLPAETQFRYKAMTGRPMIGVELRVVRPDGKDIAADGREVGEIIVRGETVSPGYWRRPRETREAFRDGWLHTGDLAVRDPEGYLNIVDRWGERLFHGA